MGTVVGTGHRLYDPPRLWELGWFLFPSPSIRCQSSSTNDTIAFTATTSVSFAQWHYRLDHMCESRLSKLICSGDTSLPCMGCKLVNQLQFPYSSSQTVSTWPFDFINYDVWGLALFVSKVGHCCYVIFIDGFFRFTWVFLRFTSSSAHSLSEFCYYNLHPILFSCSCFFGPALRTIIYHDWPGQTTQLVPTLGESNSACYPGPRIKRASSQVVYVYITVVYI